MNTGHDGSLTSIHANSPRDALMRVETMVAMTGLEIPAEFLRKYISSALDVIIQTARLADGTRKIISIQEITGMEGNVTSLQEIFVFEQTGVDNEGKVKGMFRATGIRPRFIEKFHIMGIPFQAAMFDPGRHIGV
jgi:pilus assembly protein CpaF